MFVTIRDRVPGQALHIFEGGEGVVEAGARRGQRMATAQRRVHQLARPDAVAEGLPEFIAAIGLQPLDSGFSASAALHHALDCFEPVEIVAVDTAVTHAQGFGDAGVMRELEGGNPPGDRQAGARHVWKP